MPLYEYVCKDCDRRFDTLVRNGDGEVTCRLCEGSNVRRLMSSFAMVGGYDDPIVAGDARAAGGCCGGSCGCGH